MNSQIFLSASIPDEAPFDQDIQVKPIRDAVLALVTVCKDLDLHLVFGGHPAISPLVHHAAESLGVIEKITIYQSNFYRKFAPKAALEFPDLRWTEPGHDDESSQANMRDAMINPNNWQYGGAIFLGGKKGIFDEAKRFHKAYPGKPMIPLRSTGGATRMLIAKLKDDLPKDKVAWQLLDSEEDATTMLRYRRKLRMMLSRYASTKFNNRTKPMSNPIDGVRIWLSGSMPDDASDDERQRIEEFLREFSKEVYARRGRLVHGSHPTIRNTLVEAAESFKETPNGSGLVLVVSRYYSKKPDESKVDLKRWNAASAERVIETAEALGDNDHEAKTKSLEILRNTLLEQCNVIIAVGGRWWDVAKGHAGVPEEIKLAADQHLPLFLLGGLGGATRDYLASKAELLNGCKNGLTAQQNLELAAVTDPAELARRVVDQIAQLPVRYRNPHAGRPFRILCLDGGGIRGAYTAAVLAYWEQAENCRVVDHFDLIAGTSTGGILAIGLGLGMSARQMLEFYRKEGPVIFPTENEMDRLWHSFRHWFGSKFDQAILKAALEKAYNHAPQGGTSLDNSLCRLLVPSYNTKTDKLVLFRTPHGQFKATHAGQNPVTAALSTAAAPTYFDPVAAAGVVAKIEAVDGGVWANNPGTVALGEAVNHLGIPLERIEMLSIGTTYSVTIAGQPFLLDKSIIGKVIGLGAGPLAGMAAKLFWQDAPIRGKIGWVANIAEFLMKTQAQTADHVCAELLGDRFLRIDDPSTAAGLDDVKAIEVLTGLGEEAAKKHLKDVRHRFLNGVPADAWKLA